MILNLKTTIAVALGLGIGLANIPMHGMERRQASQQLIITNQTPYQLAVEIELTKEEKPISKVLKPNESYTAGKITDIANFYYKPINAGFLVDRILQKQFVDVVDLHAQTKEQGYNFNIIITKAPPVWYNPLPKLIHTISVLKATIETSRPQVRRLSTAFEQQPAVQEKIEPKQISMQQAEIEKKQECARTIQTIENVGQKAAVIKDVVTQASEKRASLQEPSIQKAFAQKIPSPYNQFSALKQAVEKNYLILPADIGTEIYDSRVPPHFILGLSPYAPEAAITKKYTDLKQAIQSTQMKAPIKEIIIEFIDDAYKKYSAMVKSNSYKGYLTSLGNLGIYLPGVTFEELTSAFPSLANAIKTKAFTIPGDIIVESYDDRIPPHLILGISAYTPALEAELTLQGLQRTSHNNPHLLSIINAAYQSYLLHVTRKDYQQYLDELSSCGIYKHTLTLSDLIFIFPALNNAIITEKTLTLPTDIIISNTTIDSRIPYHLIFGTAENADVQTVQSKCMALGYQWQNNKMIQKLIEKACNAYLRMISSKQYEKYLNNLKQLGIYHP